MTRSLPTRAAFWLVTVTWLSGCPRGGEPEAHERHGGHDEPDGHDEHGDTHGEHDGPDEPGEGASDHAEAPDEADGAADTLRVDPSMLRDLRITTRTASSRPAGDAVTVLGEVRVNEDAYAEIGTSIPARVVRVIAAPGDVVEAGAPLVELESPEVGRARAEVETTRARLELARASVTRRRALREGEVVPERLREEAEAELSAAEAEHRGARDALAALGASRGGGARFVLTSPVAGTVIERTALRGALASADHPLFVVADLRRLWLVVHAFERDALRMHEGTSARVTLLALPGQTATATVARIGSRVDEAARTIDVRLELDNPDGTLRPGMAASVLVPVGDDDETVVTVPVESVQRLGDGWCVFLPRDAAGSFEIRRVGRGRDLAGEVEILTGLRVGERVVVDGAFLLKAEADEARGGGGEHHHH